MSNRKRPSGAGRTPGAIGPGYLPKGGRPEATRLAVEAGKPTSWAEHRALAASAEGHADGGVSVSAPTPAVRGPEAGARSRAGRGLSVEGLALIGAVSGVGSAVTLLLHTLITGG